VTLIAKGSLAFLAIALVAGCEVPSTHLSATRWGGADATVADTRVAQTAAETNPPVADGPAADDALAPDDPDGVECPPPTTIDLTIPNGNVMLVVDRSSTMSSLNDPTCEDCGTYWTSVLDAVNQLTSSTTNHFRWGLKLFPSPDAPDACFVAPGVEVPLARDANASIMSALMNSGSPSGGAPATYGLRQVRSYLRTALERLPGALVLVMGEAPTCAAQDPAQEDMQAAVAEVGVPPSPVYVLSVGGARQKLDALAFAGYTYGSYSVDQVSNLLGAMEAGARAFGQSCAFPLPSVVSSWQLVTASLDDTPLIFGDPNGFIVSGDGTQLIIQGGPCAFIGTHSTLTITVGCGG
jgi:hypothetical protein